MKDAIWNWFAFWGPVARDVLSIVLAGLGAFLAWRAIQMGKEQRETSRRQAAIAEKQDALFEYERKAAPQLRLALGSQNLKYGLNGIEKALIVIDIVNSGNKNAKGFHWTFTGTGVGGSSRMLLTVRDAFGGPGESGHATTEVFAGQRMAFADLRIGGESAEESGALVFWSLMWDGGRCPQKRRVCWELVRRGMEYEFLETVEA